MSYCPFCHPKAEGSKTKENYYQKQKSISEPEIQQEIDITSRHTPRHHRPNDMRCNIGYTDKGFLADILS